MDITHTRPWTHHFNENPGYKNPPISLNYQIFLSRPTHTKIDLITLEHRIHARNNSDPSDHHWTASINTLHPWNFHSFLLGNSHHARCWWRLAHTLHPHKWGFSFFCVYLHSFDTWNLLCITIDKNSHLALGHNTNACHNGYRIPRIRTTLRTNVILGCHRHH